MKYLIAVMLCIPILPLLTYSDPVTDILTAAKTYENSIVAQYDVTEKSENKLTKQVFVKKYTVLKKGPDEVIQEGGSNTVRLKKNGKEKSIVEYSVIEADTTPSPLDMFLSDYQSGKISATVNTKNETYVIKGKRDDLTFKVIFSQNPVVVLSYETTNKKGDTVAEGTFNYIFKKDGAQLTDSEESGKVEENGKVVSKYKRTIQIDNYKKKADIPSEAFDDNTLKSKHFPKVKEAE
jgi:hypothetical protein